SIAFFATRRWVRTIDEPRVASAAENTLGLAAGSVRGVLELARHVPAGTSPALFRRAEADVAKHLAGKAPAQLAGAEGRAIRRGRAALARRRRRAEQPQRGSFVERRDDRAGGDRKQDQLLGDRARWRDERHVPYYAGRSAVVVGADHRRDLSVIPAEESRSF